MSADLPPLYAIWAILMLAGGTAWVLGLRAWGNTFGEGERGPARGQTTVPRPPAKLCKEIARRLSEQSAGLSVRVLACDETMVKARLFPLASSQAALAQRPDEGALLRCRLEADGTGTHLSWTVDGRPLNRAFRTAMKVVLGLGFLALLIAGVVVPTVIIPSPEEGVRWQVVQTIQVIHVLWPPFLLAFVARRRRAMVEARTGDMLANLAYL